MPQFCLRALYRGPHRLHLLLWACSGAVLFAHPAVAREIRVGLKEDVATVTIGSSTSAILTDDKNRTLGKLPALQGFDAVAASGGVSLAHTKAWQITVKPQEEGFVYVGDRWYRGQVSLIRSGGGFTVVNRLNIEDYVASVIGKEMYPTWPLEALKAQAVASRSYAIFQQQRPKFKLFDVLSTTTSQVYAGLTSEANSTQAAVKATSGEVLTYQGKLVEAVFHASSGGHTENSENVWVSPVPYLRGVPDFDQTAPVYQWSVSFNAAQLRQRIPGIGDIISMKPIKTTPNGRVQLLKVQGNAGSVVMKGSSVRKALGLRSTLFSTKPAFGLVAGATGSTNPSGFEITGRGSGHGLGMSQWGAYSLANQGKSYREILSHYFQGTTIRPMP